MRTNRMVVAFFLATSLLPARFAQSDEPGLPSENANNSTPSVSALPALPNDLHNALQDKNFAEAVQLIDVLVGKEAGPPADYLLYLKGRSQTELGLMDRARTTYAALEEQHPQSRWIARARFGRADTFVRERNYRAAGEVYRAEANRLLSDGRRDELTGIYLEFADRYFEGVAATGPTEKKTPDYKQAAEYYQQALSLKPTLGLRQRIELRIGRCHHELSDYTAALAAYQGFLRQYAAESTEPENRAPVGFEVEVRYQLGRAQLEAGQGIEARKTWQDFLNDESMQQSAGDLLAQAAYRIALTYGVPAPPTVGDLELAVAAVDKFVEVYPKHELAPQAEFEIAQSFVHHGRHPQAIERLKSLIGNQDYAESSYVAEARKLLGESLFAQQKFDEAIAAWREFLDSHPSNPSWSDVQRRVIDSEFQTAAAELQRKHYDAARKLWETFLNKYPLDDRAARILFEFGRMKYAQAVSLREEIRTPDDQDDELKLPSNRRELSDQERRGFEQAVADWQRLVSKYPDAAEASRAQYMIGVTLEDQLGRLEEALKAYEQVQGGFAEKAQARIAQLTTEQLELLTVRKFRSNESPQIQLTTRNIENVSIKVYKVDMADYFRKMHLTRGVELLDIALIDPDKSWEYAVDGYEKHRRLVNPVSIPMEGPGVTAVTVSSDKLEATTMVVVSDLDIVVKNSRNELFVFAENLRTHQPIEGATLLISDGQNVFAEELTGGDGILQKSYDQLKTVDDLRVFALHEGHSASTISELSGLDFAVGLSPKGYLYTDRPAYRAGELVNLKGLVRWVADDRYVFREGDKYRLDVYDARSRLIHTGDVQLNQFGTFADHFAIPESVPQGECRVHLHQPAGSQSYETRFQIHATQLEPVRLTVELPRKVYYRGEKIEGKISLKYYYGTPLAKRTVQYQISEDRLNTAETDDNGEITFEFPTRRYSESQPLLITAHYPERGIAAHETVLLATRGFEINIETLRDVYIAGETFDATVTVADPSGTPVATELKLEVFEQTLVDGRQGERLLEAHELVSEDKKGKARQTLRIDKSGRYVLRATGTDRFGNTVSGSHPLLISGEEDEIRLRILADSHYHNVGDTARVQLHWREDPALALVTYEGARVLGYQLVNLQQGSNPVEIPVTAELAPNFVLGVVVMRKNRFHEAASEFRVSRRLQIELKPSQTTLLPGDDLNVEVVVTDPQGRPVSAELSLVLIQQNLLDYFLPEAGGRPVVDEFFGGGYRKPSVRAASSVTFHYRPATRGINSALLAEAERREILEMEERARTELSEAERVGSLSGARMLRLDEPVEALEEEAGDRFDRLNAGPLIDRDEAAASLRAPRLDAESPAMAGTAISGGGVNAPSRRGVRGDSTMFSRSRRRHLGLQLEQQLDRKSGVGIEPPASQSFHDADFGRNFNESLRQSGRGAVDFLGAPAFDTARPLSELLGAKMVGRHDVQDLRLLSTIHNSNGRIIALNRAGELQDVAGLPVRRLEELADDGFQVLPGTAVAETGYWNPAVVTGEDGRATVTFRLPDRSTAWRLLSQGIDSDTLCGDAEIELITKKDLFGEIKAPLAFTEGDRAELLVEVHNVAVEKGRTIEVALKSTIDERTTELRKSLESTGPGIQELSFPVEITAGKQAGFELTVQSADISDRAVATVPIRPYGMDVFAVTSGTTGQNTIAYVAHDKNMAVEQPRLEIIIGPSIDRTLVDAVLGSGLSVCEHSLPHSGLERSVSDVLGGVALLDLVGNSRDTDTPEAEALAGRVQSSIAQLVASQRDDGGWSWTGGRQAKEADRFLTSRAVWALALARSGGFAVSQETFDKATAYLKTSFSKTSPSEREAQAILLHGMTAAGAGDFALANRLYRERNRLSPSGQLHLALVLAQLDRKEMAAELLDLVKISVDPRTANALAGDAAIRTVIPWMQDGVELRALYLLALEDLRPTDSKVSALAEWLLSARRGSRWSPEKTNGPAVAALARWSARTRHAAEKYTLSVFVNDQLVEKLEVDPSKDPSRRLEVAAGMLVNGRPQRINFDIEGRGRFSYSAVMSGFVPAEKLKSTTQLWHISRTYEPALRMLEGEEIPRGFGVLTGSYKSYRNDLTQLPLANKGEVTLSVSRYRASNAQDDQYDYLVLTEPLPAGTTVLTDSIRGNFERYEVSPGAITFYLGDQPYIGNIHYTLLGYLPGEYRTAPSLVQSFYRPERIAVAEAKSLRVLGRGVESSDPYRLTPVELYEFGKRLAARQRYGQAEPYLTELFNKFRLRDEVYQDVVQLLFRTALAGEKNDRIVQYFEIIKEKYPEVEIDFESILAVAQSYQELGEYERSFLVYRATLEAAFQRESQIAGFLDERGEFLRSVAVVERLLADYPPEAYIAAATYSLAQEVFGKGPEAAADAGLRSANISRVQLVSTAARMLDHFLSTWPNDPAADQAGFSLANALLDLEHYEEVITRCRQSAERYPNSPLLDSFWYVIGYSQFALGRHDRALEMCKKVAEATHRDPKTGAVVAASNKWQAVYIMGQIFHSLGQPSDAIREYERVKTHFPDANEAIDFFTRQEIRLPEITTIKPGDESRVPLEFRNVASANVKVYRIDLLKFGLMQRSLNRITSINLAGIRPYHEMQLELGDGHDYRDREAPLLLPLKDEGAYLVVCRGGNLYASGLVLVSPLTVQVQEDAESGRVRVTVKDIVADRYAADVHVKVTGSRNDAFFSGDTDLRGIFVADNMQGITTVIARSDANRYAFYRGKTPLGQDGSGPQDGQSVQQQAIPKEPASGRNQLLDNLLRSNSVIQQEQRQMYRNLLQNKNQGVKAKAAY